MTAPSSFRRVRNPVPKSVAIRLVALGALAMTSGCTAMIFDAYSGHVMTEPLYIWILDGDQPEIRVVWSRRSPKESDPYKAPAAKRAGNHLSIRPSLARCSALDVFVNDRSSPLRVGDDPIQHWAIESDAPTIPDDRFPECSVLITYRHVESPQQFVLTAATRDGVVAEFENGKRKPAWLLFMPAALVADATGTALAMALAMVLVVGGL